MKTKLDLQTWARKDHFHFFRQFEEPFFGITVLMDCSKAYPRAKENQWSFFLYYLHASLVAANELARFRYRIEEDQVWEYDTVNASPTINRPNGSFGFGYMDYHANFSDFSRHATEEIKRVQASTGLVPSGSGDNVIHYSSLPWINFQSISHARSFSFKDSCPKISFGKMTDTDGKKQMPVSVHVHHALMDGYHVAQFIDRFQALLNE